MQINLAKQWYRDSISFWMLCCLPFSWLFRLITAVRHYLFYRGYIKINHFPVPVIVVGNITVGGTGKTPFVVWLAALLKSQGYHPGIVSRGVGGKAQHTPFMVTPNAKAQEVGDEALLLQTKTNCPLVVCTDRSKAVAHLLHHENCNVVISDDGLQHYRLGRKIEIAMIDAKRGFGNQQLLPAGPLREPIARLANVNFIVINNGTTGSSFQLPFIQDNKAIHSHMTLQIQALHSVKNPEKQLDLKHFPQKNIHAIAGIGHPEQFFATLESVGFTVIRHVFADHHLYQPQDIEFNDNLPVFMTEKDAVKCKSFASDLHWYLPVNAVLPNDFQNMLLSLVREEKKHDKEFDFQHASISIISDSRSHSSNASSS